jgi:hypothetical protein
MEQGPTTKNIAVITTQFWWHIGSWSCCKHGTVNHSITVAELYRFVEDAKAGQSVDSRVQDIALLDILDKRREMTVGTQNNQL